MNNSTNPFAVLGIGHNSDRFLRWTNTKKNINFLIDDSLEKQGLYIANCPIEISKDIATLDKKCHLLLGVHPRDVISLTKKLKEKYNLNNIHSIFDLPKILVC